MDNKRKPTENWEIPPISPIPPIKNKYISVKKNKYIKNFLFLGGNRGNREKNKENGAFFGLLRWGKQKTKGEKLKTNRTKAKKQSENNNKNFFYFFT